MRAFIKALFHGGDNSAEMHVALYCLSTLVFLGLSIYVVVIKGVTFDGITFGAGLAGVASAFGAAALSQGGQRKMEGQNTTTPPQT